MWNSLRIGLLAVSGLSFGLLAAAGVFTVLVAVGLIPRFCGRTHTANKVILYENMVILGTIIGGLGSVTRNYFTGLLPGMAGNVLLFVIGLFAGMFVGCLALAIAEMLDSIPIFARRINFVRGLKAAIFAMAFGKFVGSLFYFFFSLHEVIS